MDISTNMKDDALDLFSGKYKTALILLAIGIGGYIIYKSVKGISKVGDEFSFGGSGIGDFSNSSVNVNAASITQEGAEIIAAKLLDAMDGFGTDEEAIFDALKGKNKSDFIMISNAFGTPRYDGAGESHWPFAERSLVEWLTRELSSQELAELKKLMPRVFNK